MEAKTVQLRCKDCGGIMNVEENKTVLSCPYCGSKEFISESDEVKIEKIKNDTYKEIELQKLKYEEQRERRLEDQEKQKERLLEDQREAKEFLHSALCWFIIFSLGGAMFFCLPSLISKRILSSIISIAQIILLVLSLLIGTRVIKGGRLHLHILPLIISYILIIPWILSLRM